MKRQVIGITGGIGSGKSTAAERLRLLGATVLNADETVTELYEGSEPLKIELVKAFGKEAVIEGGVNRGFISRLVFEDELNLKRLNSIVHPLVQKRMEERTAEAQGVIVWDVPLLFELGMDASVDVTVVVVADRQERIGRVMKRSGLSFCEVEKRIRAQLSDFQRIRLADYVCINNGDRESLYRQIERIYRDIRGKNQL
ncbi:MAG: dephospho-CoA kinase [Clostridia bacterium]|nr:dephospho-CoA kinase [Clostridia bacterium]